MNKNTKKCFWGNLEDKLEVGERSHKSFHYLIYEIKIHEKEYHCSKCGGYNTQCKGYFSIKSPKTAKLINFP